MGSQLFTTPGAAQFDPSVLSGNTSVKVICIAGGSSGAYSGGEGAPGGGGGACAVFTKMMSPTDDPYDVYVGAGGETNYIPVPGENSSFADSSDTLCLAAASVDGQTGGAAGDCIGAFAHSGGNGGNGVADTNGGGGGGGAGASDSQDGSNGAAGSGGSGGSGGAGVSGTYLNGGGGGDGGDDGSAGGDGLAYGGGGGGVGADLTGLLGGRGADGAVLVLWGWHCGDAPPLNAMIPAAADAVLRRKPFSPQPYF